MPSADTIYHSLTNAKLVIKGKISPENSKGKWVPQGKIANFDTQFKEQLNALKKSNFSKDELIDNNIDDQLLRLLTLALSEEQKRLLAEVAIELALHRTCIRISKRASIVKLCSVAHLEQLFQNLLFECQAEDNEYQIEDALSVANNRTLTKIVSDGALSLFLYACADFDDEELNAAVRNNPKLNQLATTLSLSDSFAATSDNDDDYDTEVIYPEDDRTSDDDQDINFIKTYSV